MLINGYLTRHELQKAVGDDTDVHDDDYDRAIEAASRLIDKWAGRHFWQDYGPTPRLFGGNTRTDVSGSCANGPVDFVSTDGVVVETDDDGDGVFETLWDRGQWQAQPFVLYNQQPYQMVTTTTRSREFPISGRTPSVRITARWGWERVPRPIELACMSLSTLFYRSKDMSGSSMGFDTDIERVSADPISVAMKLVGAYAIDGGTLYMPAAA